MDKMITSRDVIIEDAKSNQYFNIMRCDYDIISSVFVGISINFTHLCPTFNENLFIELVI